jgi:hypothetical protein
MAGHLVISTPQEGHSESRVKISKAGIRDPLADEMLGARQSSPTPTFFRFPSLCWRSLEKRSAFKGLHTKNELSGVAHGARKSDVRSNGVVRST